MNVPMLVDFAGLVCPLRFETSMYGAAEVLQRDD